MVSATRSLSVYLSTVICQLSSVNCHLPTVNCQLSSVNRCLPAVLFDFFDNLINKIELVHNRLQVA